MEYTNSPYKEIPSELISSYTFDNVVPILDWYFDGTNDLVKSVWTDEYINEFKLNYTSINIYGNTLSPEECYGRASSMLLKAFETHNIKNKKVAVIGSISPWIEAILLNLDNEIITVEYNIPENKTTQLQVVSYWDFQKTQNMYDCIVTYSSIEHSGLGRYGDPLDPNGDIKTMDDIHNNLNENGLLIWGGPVGSDALVWNAHRVYGRIRLPLLFSKFEEMEWIGYNKDELLNKSLDKCACQPVIVLKKK